MPRPTIFSYSLEDAAGVTASAYVFVAYDAITETVAALLGAASDLGGLIDAVTGMKITDFNVNINGLPDPAWKAAAIANIDAEQTLLLNLSIVDTVYTQEFDLPGLRDTLIVNGRPVLTDGAAIDNLVEALTGETGLGTVSVNSKFLLDLTGLVSAAVTFRKHKKKRKSVSYVAT